MKAILLREFGGPETLTFGEVATPKPEPGEVLVAVRNVSVNVTLDIIVRKGLYPTKPALPHVLGTDPVGEVVAVGEGVSNVAPGQRVGVHAPLRSKDCPPGQEADDPGRAGLVGVTCWGGYAEYASIPAEIRAELGIDDGLVRLSVGVEDIDDLIGDLENALA